MSRTKLWILWWLCVIISVCIVKGVEFTPEVYSNVTLILADDMQDYTNVTLELGFITDTCTYSSGTWIIDCSDNCEVIETDLDGNDIIINQSLEGQGNVTFSGDLTNIGDISIVGFNSANKCIVTCDSGGCFK